MLHSMMNTLFRCGHQRTTFPITPRRRYAGTVTNSRSGTYVACLDCGREFAYDWKEMRIGEQMAAPAAVAQTQASVQ
jgi:hypothetical protein